MSTRTDIDARFANLDLDPIPQLSAGLVPMPAPLADGIEIEWDDAPATTPGIPEIRMVDDLYKGRFQGHKDFDSVLAAVPELGATVTKEPLFTRDGAIMPGAYATLRRMPGEIQGLGVVGERYRVVQDPHAFKIMEPLMERGVVSTLTAGVYKAKSWLYGEGGTFKADIVPGDTIEARVLIGNSHDGSIPWSFGFPGNRVVCQNTFHMALSSKLSKLLKVRHTTNANEIVQQVTRAVEAFGYEFVTSVDKMRAMAQVQVSSDTLKEYTGYVFSKWADTEEEEASNASGSKLYAKVLENFEAGAGAQFHRGTLWGAYNAVTEYTSHQRSRSEDPNAAFADNQWGAGALINKRAFDRALELV